MRMHPLPTLAVEKLSSSRLALVLVILLILFSIAGAVFPQEGLVDFQDIARWQAARPVISGLAQPLGFFRVFHSLPFLTVIVVLAFNTLLCTLLRFHREGGPASLKGPGAVRRTGFLALHLSIILLLAGSGLTSATKMQGRIVLTEGQEFQDQHENYTQLVEGPFRRERHTGARIRLKRLQIDYREGHPVGVTSSLDLRGGPGDDRDARQADVRVNGPLDYRGIAITQDKTGFSPRIRIRRSDSRKPLVDSFIALQTFETREGKLYEDFLALPFVLERFIFTVYPDYVEENGRFKKTGDTPLNPVLRIEVQDAAGTPLAEGSVALGGEVELAGYRFAFPALRQWTGLLLVDDAGYWVVAVALWLGLAAMILRYVPVLTRWFAASGEAD